jgi:hypothetical protein
MVTPFSIIFVSYLKRLLPQEDMRQAARNSRQNPELYTKAAAKANPQEP